MIKAWLDFPTVGLFAVLVALYTTAAAVIVIISFAPRTGKAVRRVEGIVAPFFGSIGVLFALLTGFLANDIADRNRQAGLAVQSEAGELRNIYTLSITSVSDRQSIRTALTAYVKALIEDEWPAMEKDQQARSAFAAYDALLQEVSDPRIAQDAGAAVHTALLNAAVRAGTSRSDRLALAFDRTSDIKWILVLVLGVLTQVSIGLVHLQKRGAQTAALSVFTIAAVITLGLIALQERSFTGDVRVGPGPLVEVAKLLGQ